MGASDCTVELFDMLDELIEFDAPPNAIVESVREFFERGRKVVPHSGKPRKPRRDKSQPRAQSEYNTDNIFDEFWAAYPRRQGANPKKPAFEKFRAAVKNGVDPMVIIQAAKDKIGIDGEPGTPMVPMAATWLNQRRWECRESSITQAATEPQKQGIAFVLRGSPQWDAWEAYNRLYGLPLPSAIYSKHFMEYGWGFPSEWPPNHRIPEVNGSHLGDGQQAEPSMST